MDKYISLRPVIILIFIWIILIGNCLPTDAQEVRSQRVSNYTIQVELDPLNKKLKATQEIRWTNTSTDTVGDLQFHLYYNAFKNNQSTFYKGSDRSSLLKTLSNKDCHWSYSDIHAISINHGDDLLHNLKFIQPDDDNTSDQTVVQLLMDNPVLPGETISIHLGWEAKIPNIKVRTGYNKDFYFFAQWFPKLGRYEPANSCNNNKGQWKCHQYHAQGEFYADFGNYQVEITAPSDFIVGASGSLKTKNVGTDSTMWTYEVDDVIDFAWTASPHFSIQNNDWRGVHLSLLTYPGHEHCGDRYFKTIKQAMSYMDERLGRYPYPTLTIVDPPIHGIFTGGMEYPTLITSLSFCFLPEGIRTTETLTVHEFIHQYFMHMVASNEYEEPWLDEGITTYYEGRIMDHFYGERSSTIEWLGMTVGNAEYNRWEYFNTDHPKIADNTFRSSDFKQGGYSRISYNKTAVWLRTLEGLVGIETMDAIMKAYFERWKFKHPCADDFEDVVNEVIREREGDRFGEDMTWFFDQVIRGTNECDYKLYAINSEVVKEHIGYFSNLDNCDLIPSEDVPMIKSSVIIHRLGEMIMPQEISLFLKDGQEIKYTWDGQDRSYAIHYVGTQQVIKAIIDPDRKIYIDKNFINNSYMVEPNLIGTRFYFTHFVEKMQHLMLGMSLFI